MEILKRTTDAKTLVDLWLCQLVPRACGSHIEEVSTQGRLVRGGVSASLLASRRAYDAHRRLGGQPLVFEGSFRRETGARLAEAASASSISAWLVGGGGRGGGDWGNGGHKGEADAG
eukprot:6225599-Prymnesium_polylepis.1